MASFANGEADPSQDVWNLLYTEDGDAYYYNRLLSVTQWDKPDGFIVDLVQ